jgi:SAM-dependent methyltransferase
MPMNLMHRKLCASRWWARKVSENLPTALRDVRLGDDVLEVGPGFGATTRVLVDLVPRLTCLEIDADSVEGLRAEFGDRVEVVPGDGASMPFADQRFSAVVCFTMLHHVPSVRLQDQLFAEARRVLRPGGVFRGVDSQPSAWFRLLHIGDTMVTLDPGTLDSRLTKAGFTDIQVRMKDGKLGFWALAGTDNDTR